MRTPQANVRLLPRRMKSFRLGAPRVLVQSLVFAGTLIAFTALGAAVAHGQQVYGSINGNVADSTGGAISNGNVAVKDATKGVVFKQKTNSAGFYSQGQLIPGTYIVEIEAPGFKKVVSTPLTVSVDQVTRFDATLTVGSATETIQVTSEAPLLQSDRVDVATVLSSKDVLAIPTYQRSVLSLEFLTPGVLTNPASTPQSENPQGSFRARVNGQMWGQTGYQLDGTDNQDAWLGSAIINPTADSVFESKFSTENFDAENGYVAGGLLVTSTKSGSNQFHGSLFEYLINNSPGFRTAAANPFTQRNGAPPLKSNQFGGSFGGRILPDKLFFFGDVQIQRRREGDSLLTTVPTLRVRQTCLQGPGPCDLSEYLNGGLNQIYDPLTGNSSTGQGRTPFAGNIIPSNRLSQQAINILNLFPAPNAQVGGLIYRNNYIATGSQVFNSEQYDTREDYYLNNANSIFVRYTLANFFLSVPGAFGSLQGGPGLDSTGYSGISNVRNQSLALGYTHSFNTGAVNEFRFGWYRYNVHEIPGGFGTQPAADAGIPGLNLDNTLTSGLPAFNITGDGGAQLGYSLTVNRCNCPLTERENQYQILDNLTKVIGNHTLKFGADIRRTSNLRVPSDGHRSGELTFAPGFTGLGNANGGTNQGLGLATFLLGETTSFSRYVSTVNDATAYLERPDFYAQDTWHLLPRLTLTYGLRWEMTFPESTGPGKGGLLDVNTGNVVVFGVGGNSSRGFQKTVYTYFAPRLGIAYQLTPKTVIRAGYGWAYGDGWAGSIFNSANIQLPVLLAQANTPANASQGVFTLGAGPSTPVFPAVSSSGTIALPNGITETTRPASITRPTVYAYNATLQRELNNKIAVSLAYVGNSGRHTASDTSINFNINQAAFVPGVSNLNLLKPFFAKYGWTQPINYFCNCAVNQYNSLRAAVDVKNYHGYTATGTYLYQHDYGDGTGNAFTSYTMLYDRPLGYGNYANTPHSQVIVVQNYELPFGRGKHFGNNLGTLADALVGGWQLSGITNYLSGLPFTAGIGTYPAGYAFPSVGPNYPDRGNVSPYAGAAHDRTQWFQGGLGGAFLLPAPNTFGNNGFNNLYGPHFFQQDLVAQKSVVMREKYKVSLRADAFNVFNNTNLGLPNTNITDPKAGQITSLAPNATMRRLQFALRMDF